MSTKPILITGVAGFIGFHVCKALLERGEKVIGIDNMNSYYDRNLKKMRLEKLKSSDNGCFTFHKIDITDRGRMNDLTLLYPDIKTIIHLAAQAGVRHSIKEPFSYADSNLTGQLSVLEICRKLPNMEHFVYASSSSVYGGNKKLPFAEGDRVDNPISLYAATKKAGEMLAHSYNNMFDIPATGLRFFTVYGPWGRPDMAYFFFTKALLGGEEITLFENGTLKRDFTYIDDIVNGILAAVKRIPSVHTLYNLGNNKTESVNTLVSLLEKATEKKAIIKNCPMPVGDVPETFADITLAQKHLGFNPTTSLHDGIPRFVEWYKEYYANQAD